MVGKIFKHGEFRIRIYKEHGFEGHTWEIEHSKDGHLVTAWSKGTVANAHEEAIAWLKEMQRATAVAATRRELRETTLASGLREHDFSTPRDREDFRIGFHVGYRDPVADGKFVSDAYEKGFLLGARVSPNRED